MQPSTTQTSIIRVKGDCGKEETDFLAAEEPLEIRLIHGPAANRQQQNVSVTMRTPGQDFDLATGFLFTEGIVRSAADIRTLQHYENSGDNIVRVGLAEEILVNISKLERNFYTTSSCGVCGKASIEAVRSVCHISSPPTNALYFPAKLLLTLPEKLRQAQALFGHTGGLHGCALFDATGNLILSREDVGRHNAVDKLIGAALRQNLFPLGKYLLLLSGRVSFELVQKAWMAGLPMIAAIGAPSSLAVQTAADAGITLAGFLRNGGFNIYAGENRILISEHEDSHQGQYGTLPPI